MNSADITPVILTSNEEANIARTLEGLHWAQRVVVLDSGSTDETEFICRSNPRVDFNVRPFDQHAAQWNAALAFVQTPWVLALDADYCLGPGFVEELIGLPEDPDRNGYRVNLVFCQNGRPLRASLLPPRICLFRAGKARYIQDGHTQDLQLDGPCGVLASPILHDDRKPFSRWWANQTRYAALEAEKLRHAQWKELSPQDRLRKATPLAPFAVIIFCLFIKGLCLDVPAGWIYTAQRFLAEWLLLTARLKHRPLQAFPGVL